MKKMPLKILRILFFILLIINYSCQNEDIIEQKNNVQNSANATSISFEEFQKDTKAFSEYSRHFGKDINHLSSKTIYNNTYGLTIDLNNITLIKSGGYSYYIFVVYSNTQNNGIYERIYLHPQSDGKYLAFLVEYKLSDKDINALTSGQTIDQLSEKTLYTSLDKFDNGTIMRGLGGFYSNCNYKVTITTEEVFVDDHNGDVDGTNGYWETRYHYTYTLTGCTYLFSNTFVIEGVNIGGGTGGAVVSTDPFNPNQNQVGVSPLLTVSVSNDEVAIRELKKITDSNSSLRYII